MIHYIILMEKKSFQSNAFHTLHFYKKGEGNEIPDFREPTIDFKQSINALIDAGFKKESALTVEEVILNDVAEITVYFFHDDGTFNGSDRIGFFKRLAIVN